MSPRTRFASDEDRRAAQKLAMKRYQQSEKGRLRKKQLRKGGEISLEAVMALLSYDPLTGIFRWKVDRKRNAKAGDIAGTASGIYQVITIKCMEFPAHRLAWFYHYGKWPEQVLDHIDGNGRNNAIVNLRDCSRTDNVRNARARGWHPFKMRSGTVKYSACIGVNRKLKHLGLFSTKEEAREAYLAATRKYFGEFAACDRHLANPSLAEQSDDLGLGLAGTTRSEKSDSQFPSHHVLSR